MAALFGAFGSAKAPDGGAQAPVDSESARAAQILETFPDADRQSVIVVASRTEGGTLSPRDLAALRALLPVLDVHADADSTGPLVSEDGEAALLVTPIRVGATNGETAQVIEDIRSDLVEHRVAGVTTQVTGGPVARRAHGAG